MLTVAVCMNVALVVVSSSTAGLLVEDGQRLGATGRLTSTRMVVIARHSSLAGCWAGGSPSTTSSPWIRSSAVLLFSLVPVVLFLLHEPKLARRDIGAFKNGWEQIIKLRGAARCGPPPECFS